MAPDDPIDRLPEDGTPRQVTPEPVHAVTWLVEEPGKFFDADVRAVYMDDERAECRGSLAALLRLVPTGADVLDVGIGGGSLGRRLAAEGRCKVDGVTISPEEARSAAAFYRHIEVADLSDVGLDSLFVDRRYDVIVCADVLEHLPRPTQVLDACRKLLAADGVLLLSIPNVGYIGLLGELLAGEFRYRIEGLLDRTHLRFFTRRSLLRMLKDSGWQVDHVETVKLDLPDSEFRVSFEQLPPALRRHLLAIPDALTYQFVVKARPVGADMDEHAGDLNRDVEESGDVVDSPGFSVLLYLKDSGGYAEGRKLLARGTIGEKRQRIRFDIPAQGTPLTGLRVDPADRPGFLHLFALRVVTPAGAPIWSWNGEAEVLACAQHQQLLFHAPLFSQSGAVLLSTGDDPFFELPLPQNCLGACRDGAAVEIELGWPMSADYALFLEDLARRQSRIGALESELGQLASVRSALEQQIVELSKEVDQGKRLKIEHEALAAVAERLRREVERHSSDAQALREELATLRRGAEQQRATNDVVTLQLDRALDRLRRIESSAPFKMFMRLAPRRFRAEIDTAVGAGSSGMHQEGKQASTDLSAAVDVIVPVYRGLDETRRCLESVLVGSASTPLRLIVVNDASPEAEVTAYLRELKLRDARVELLENAANVGFVASVNRAMEFSGERDVVLLNSDAEVAGDWLDRLRRPALADPRVGTVTPFSNSATICSYPRFCVDNGLPVGVTTEALDRQFALVNRGRILEIPTAVGFCMFIRRSCLNAVGLFDTERFGRGYGEENDFCMRARSRGWRHVMALDVFVHHTGGVSFGDEKLPRVREAQEILARLHPEYPVLVHRHVAEDPAQTARLAVDVARIRGSGLPSVLCVLHNTGGGTERHVRELADALLDQCNFLALRPAQGGETLLEWMRPGEGFQLGFRLPDEYEMLVSVLRSLGVGLVHFHHLLGHSPSLWGLPKSLAVPHDFTAHDFYSVCPQISLTDHHSRYCGEKGPEQCAGCLQRSPAPGRVSIETWRAGYRPLLEHARRVYAPSADATARLRRYFPDARLVHVAHVDLAGPLPAPAPGPLADRRPLRVVVLGALSPIKGADVLEATAVEAARRDAPLEFHLLGFAYRSLQKQPKARLTVHGQYEEADLPELLTWLKPDVAWFPALWPETYSYTLSACLARGVPIVAPDLGAFPARLQGRQWTWICPWDRTAAAWVDFFSRIREENFVAGTPPLAAAEQPWVPAEFVYRRDYLQGLATIGARPPLSLALLEQHRPGRRAMKAGKQSKRLLLGLAVRLRTQPLLRGLVRRVPLRWQTRAKVWLST